MVHKFGSGDGPVFHKAWFLPLYTGNNCSIPAAEKYEEMKSGKKSCRITVWPARPLNTSSMYLVYNEYKVPLRDVVDLKSWGCRKLKSGNTGGPIHITVYNYMSLLVQNVRFAGIVPLLLLPLCRCCTARVVYKFERSVGSNLLGCYVQDSAPT